MALTALIAAVFCALGLVAGYLVRHLWTNKKFGSIEDQLKKQLGDAETKAKEIIIEAKEKSAAILVEIKNDEQSRRKEIIALESKVSSREEALDKRSATLSSEEANLRTREEKLRAMDDDLRKREGDIKTHIEKVAGLSREEARETVVKEAKEERAKDLASTIQKMDKENRDEIEKKAGGHHHDRAPALCAFARRRDHDDAVPVDRRGYEGKDHWPRRQEYPRARAGDGR